MTWTARSRHGSPPLLLALVPVVIGLVQVVGTTFAAMHQQAVRPLDGLAYLLLVAGPVALLWRTRAPEVVLMMTFAVTLAYELRGYPGGPVYLALAVAYVFCAVFGRRQVAYATLAGGYVLLVVGVPWVTGRGLPSAAMALGVAAWLLVLLAIGEGIRQRRAAAREHRLRARQERLRREEEARRQATEERLDIARELHDVVAHSLSLINVQSGVALELLDRRPEQARDALTAIKTTSRDALVEVQGVLNSLRRKGESAPNAPSPTLRDLDALVAGVRGAGVEVSVVMEGAAVPLPSRVELAASRIVQEALTNVARHAHASRAVVTLRYLPDRLEVQVDDDGHGSSVVAGSSASAVVGIAGGGGNGIPGMRERAAALGGELSAGPIDGRGFRVFASLPVPPRAAQGRPAEGDAGQNGASQGGAPQGGVA
ncbi:MAG TPA: histidine kinase [Actinomycetales bacterium]|nr:histidine kinase [Actinomycetales bacterium]